MMLTARSVLVAVLSLAWLVPAPARAVPNPGTRLCFGALELRGLKGRARKQTHLKVIKALRKFGAEIPQDTFGMVIEPDCLQDAKCVVWALNDVEPVDGVLAVFATRKRQKVHVTVALYNGKTGEKAFEETFTTRARRFPKRANFNGPIERGLEALQRGEVYKPPAPPEEERPPPAEESPPVAAAPAPEPSPLATTPPAAGTSGAGASGRTSAEAAERAPRRKSGGGSPLASIVGWSGLGLGAALMATGAVTGGLAMQIDQSLAAQCDQTTMTCAYELGADYEQMRGLALATDILMGTGVVALAIGAGGLGFSLLDGGGE